MADAKSRFGALKSFREKAPETDPEELTQPPPEVEPTSSAQPGRGRGRPAGKRSNPEYEPTTVFLRKKTKRAASRRLEDIEAGLDLSDLIEKLLGDWISGRLQS